MTIDKGFILGKTITETFLTRVKRDPARVAYRFRAAKQWKSVTFQEFYDECRLVAYGLQSIGLSEGQNVALLSATRYEWALFDLAIQGSRAVTVPIYPSSTPPDTRYILDHCEARVAVVENPAQLAKVLEIRPERLTRIVLISGSAPAELPAGVEIFTLPQLREHGREEEAREPGRFERQLLEARPADLFTLCYTSGTTGVPKGAEITHDAMMSALEDSIKRLGHAIENRELRTVTFLPFSHILGRVESMLPFVLGLTQVFAESQDRLLANMMEVRPTLLFVVPRVFEKAHERIRATVEASGPARKLLFERALECGRQCILAGNENRRPPIVAAVQYRVALATIFRKIRARLGGELIAVVSGGAPLSKDIGEFFQIIGIPILEGYGLTETCGPIAVNVPEHIRFGTVGRPLDEVQVRIAEDGEILIKSRKLLRGYYKNPEATAASLQDGWYATGDIGKLDERGYLAITDRKKDLIVTSAGKNIAPQKIENIAKRYPLLSHLVVHGDRRNYLTAVITLTPELVIQFATEKEILFSEYAELVKNPKVVALVQKTVDEINLQLASYETLKKFIILPSEFTVDSGELTPSLKVRRNVIETRYREDLDRMY